MLKTWLSHPLTRGLDIDDPRTTQLRRHIIQEKSFLRQIYQEWYANIASALSSGNGPILEIGSGAGFLPDCIPGVITSEIFPVPGIDVVLDSLALPLADRGLGGLVATDVFHHFPQPRRFLEEAARCVRPGGVMVMNEPWVTPWSRLIWKYLHHEPFNPTTQEWEFPQDGALSGANSALPWIIFERDRIQFEREFPEWKIQAIKLSMPFRYLLSGGVSLRSLIPGWTFGLGRWIENTLQPWMNTWAMFALIQLQRTSYEGSTFRHC